ncbi:extracellular solute-binding protein [Paenibacillus sp. HJGM_3]|uniref:extracellular solute-binding protein n=1 Tax=Paenibacillus sp. HJGM_3 TaxID=3379816 RepID=UPI00385A2E21
MKVRYGKKMGATLAATLVLGAVLAGCGGSGGDSQASPSAAPAGGSSSAAPAGKVTLKVLVPNNVEEFPSGSDINNNEIANGIREKTGFDVQWELLPKDAEAARQKLNLTMASGDTPDLIIMNDKTLFGSFVQQGLLTPLDTLLNEVGPDIKKIYSPEQMRSASSGGKLYAIRAAYFGTPNSGFLTRKDLLQELGLSEPKNQDDFYTLLKTVKEKKPDMIPYTANLAQGLSGLDGIAAMFIPPVDYSMKDGKTVYNPVSPAAKDFLAFANKLYSEGLLDKESVVNKIENVKEKLVGGKAFMTTMGWADAKTTGDAVKAKIPSSDLGYIDAVTGKNGAYGMAKNSSVTRYMIVPRASKKAKEVMQFLNKVATNELIDYISFGVEGKHYEKKNGQYVATPAADTIRFRVYYNMFDTIELGLQRMEQKGFAPYFNPLLKPSKYENVIDQLPPVEAADKKSKEILDLKNEYFLKIITGAMPISAFDEFISKWQKAGGEDALKALTDAYNAK